MADVAPAGCDSTSPLLNPPTVAGVLVALVAVCSVISGYVAYRLGFSLAVKRLKAFKTIQKTQPATFQPRSPTRRRNILSFGFLSRSMDGTSLMGSQQFSESTFGTAEMGFMSTGESSDQAFNSLGGGSASMSFQRSKGASQIFGSGKASGGVSGLFSGGIGNRKKRRAAMQKRRIADERLKEAIKTSNVEELRTAIVAAETEGASEEMVEAAGIVCDRLVAGFLGFDLKPDEVPFHIRKDMPLAQRMGVTADQPEATTAGVPGSIPSPKPNEMSTSHEDVKLRGFIQQPDAAMEHQETELELMLKKDGAHKEHEDVAWIPIPKAGGGVKYYNYVSRVFTDTVPEKISCDFHYKPEARLRAAEDAVAHLADTVDSLQAKSEASATQVSLLRDELHTNTRQRWYSNHRSRWHNDPATTLHVEWGQIAGIVAKACTEMISEHVNDPSCEIERLDNAIQIAQKVCEKLNTGLGVTAYFAHTGVMQSERLTYEAGISDGPSKLVGRVLDASKCQLTYLAFTGGELVHVADIRADDRVYLWRGYTSTSGSFAVVPIPAPGSGRIVGVLSIDTLHRAPVKELSTLELEALEAVSASLGGLIERAEAAERQSVLQGIAATVEISGRKLNIEADVMGSTVAAEERAAKAIALSCSMQAAENVVRGRRSSAAQMEAAVYELNAVEHPSRALVSVCLALLTVIDYSGVVTEMEKREWGVPVDPQELLSLWKGTVLKGMREIAASMLMIFDHLSPADVSVDNCVRFERVEALLKRVPVSDITSSDMPLVAQLLYQWLAAAQEVNDLAVVNRQAAVTAQQFGEAPPVHRAGQVTAEILCDIICKRFG